eukprot:366061-Chlamydomonas_euryale.AAC.13
MHSHLLLRCVHSHLLWLGPARVQEQPLHLHTVGVALVAPCASEWAAALATAWTPACAAERAAACATAWAPAWAAA